MTENWYGIRRETESLTQGDLISCPVVRWKDGRVAEITTGNPARALLSSREIRKVDAIVMSQACDLANKKIANVILCRRYHLNAYKQAWQTDLRTKNPSANLDKEFQTHFTNMQKGYLWSLCALNSSEFEETKSEHQIIDFSEIFSLPRVFLDDWIAKHEKTRLSLLPPYREHLSQAFARFFMRVGLPTPLAPLK